MSGADDRYEVTIVKYGTRSTTRGEVYLNFSLYHESDGPMEMDYFFWVVQNQQRTVVVDTGFSPEGGRARNRTLLADISDLFRHFGVDPSSSPPVILTHAHYDHAGNLGLFPASKVFMAERELSFWSGRHAQRAMFDLDAVALPPPCRQRRAATAARTGLQPRQLPADPGLAPRRWSIGR